MVSCDWGVALALYNAGYRDMDPSKMALISLQNYLIRKGAAKIKRVSQLKSGDIVFYDYKHDGTISITEKNMDHVFIFDSKTQIYDWGNEKRIKHPETYNAGPNVFSSKNFGWAYRLPE